jgi:hypothetical protein
MVINEFVGQLTNEKIEERISFNEQTLDVFEDFKSNFDTLNDTEKIEILIKIIESTDETELVCGNYKLFFDNDVIKSLLRKCY